MVTKAKKLTPEEQIAKSATIIGNLPTELLAAQQRSKSHTVPQEWILNRCFNHIRKIKRFAPEDTRQPPKTDREKCAVKALREAYKTYEFLQNFKPRVGESLHPRPGTKEFSLDVMDVDEDGEYLLLEDGVVETSAPDMYAGGTGYRHVNWDAEYLMAVDGSERHHNPYWNPKEATVKPVKHFTKEEIEALNCPSG